MRQVEVPVAVEDGVADGGQVRVGWAEVGQVEVEGGGEKGRWNGRGRRNVGLDVGA